MHSLSETSHISWIYFAARLQDERRFFYICLAYAQNMLNHELNLWHAHQQAIAHVILIRSFSCVFFFILVVQLMKFASSLFSLSSTFALNESWASWVSSQYMRDICEVQHSSSSRSSTFLCAQLMLRICTDETLIVRGRPRASHRGVI